MKAFIIAILLLAVAVGTVIGETCLLANGYNKLTEAVDAFPSHVENSAEVERAIIYMEETIATQSNRFKIGICKNAVDDITAAFSSLKAAAKAKSAVFYETALAELKAVLKQTEPKILPAISDLF